MLLHGGVTFRGCMHAWSGRRRSVVCPWRSMLMSWHCTADDCRTRRRLLLLRLLRTVPSHLHPPDSVRPGLSRLDPQPAYCCWSTGLQPAVTMETIFGRIMKIFIIAVLASLSGMYYTFVLVILKSYLKQFWDTFYNYYNYMSVPLSRIINTAKNF